MRLGFNWKMFINPDPMSKRSYFFKKKKKITHMERRWGTPQNFFFAFINELEKQIFIKKTVKVGQQKRKQF